MILSENFGAESIIRPVFRLLQGSESSADPRALVLAPEGRGPARAGGGDCRAPSGPLAAFAHHRVAQGSDPGDLDLDRVAVFDILWRAFGAHPHDVAGIEGQALRHPADESGGPEQ